MRSKGVVMNLPHVSVVESTMMSLSLPVDISDIEDLAGDAANDRVASLEFYGDRSPAQVRRHGKVRN